MNHISPSVIDPIQLLTLLRDIQQHLPAQFKLTDDPGTELWKFYQTLTCTSVLYRKQMLILVTLPLLQANGHFEIYQAHNLPVPLAKQLSTTHKMNQVNLV